jgi:hypothetical protein
MFVYAKICSIIRVAIVVKLEPKLELLFKLQEKVVELTVKRSNRGTFSRESLGVSM